MLPESPLFCGDDAHPLRLAFLENLHIFFEFFLRRPLSSSSNDGLMIAGVGRCKMIGGLEGTADALGGKAAAPFYPLPYTLGLLRAGALWVVQ